MKIGGEKKLYFLFLILCIISGAIISYALLATRDFNTEVKTVSQQIYPETKVAIEIKGLAANVVEKFNVSRAAGTESEMPNIKALDQRVVGLLSALQNLYHEHPEKAKQIDVVKETYQKSFDAGKQMIAASVAQNYGEEAAWTKKFDSLNKELLLSFDNIVTASTQAHNRAMEDILAVSRQLNRVLVFSVIIMFIISAVIFYLISQISKQFDRMGEESTQATGGLLEAIENINAMSGHLAVETSTSAASLEEIVVTMDIMTNQAKENHDAAQTADNAAKSLYSTAARSNCSINDVADAMTAMFEADREITSLVKNIENIAFQTNLLALNAAVEAARAGEAGAGFAVVAGEVRNLASRTGETSGKISGIIKRLNEKVTSGVQMVDNLKATFSEINSQSDTVVREMSKIMVTGTQQADTEEKIRQAVNSIGDMVKSQASMSEEGAATVQDVKEQVERLHLMMEELMTFWEGSGRKNQN